MVDLRIQRGIQRDKSFEIVVDGQPIEAFPGETIAAVLIASGKRTFRHTAKKQQPRGLFCGIGLCHECLMVVNGVPNTRVCQTLATPGCRVESQKGHSPEEKGH